MDTSSHGDHSQNQHEEHHNVPKLPSKTDKVMTYVSKAGLFLPAMLFIVALYFYFTNQPQNMVQENYAPEYYAPTPDPQQKPPVKKQIAFNLNGPISCNYISEEAGKTSTISAQILRKQINVAINEATISSRFLVKGDCLYTWYESTGEATLTGNIDPVIQAKLLEGQKTCELKPVLQAIELMSSFGMLDPASLIGAFSGTSGTGAEYSAKEDVMQKFTDSCTQEVPAESSFEIPQNIIFKEAPKE